MGRVTRVSGDKSKYKYSFKECGYLFEYNTASELGRLMASTLKRFQNPYDPSHTEYDEFNEAVWDYRYKKSRT